MILQMENLPTDMRRYTFNIVVLDLDTMVGEGIFKNSDDTFTVLINARWSCEMQRYCLEHAFEHVRRDDWSKEDVQIIEAETHKNRTVI